MNETRTIKEHKNYRIEKERKKERKYIKKTELLAVNTVK